MVKTLSIKNLTVFQDVTLNFGRGLNVIVGENGTGKTHLLKIAYSVLSTSWEEGRKPNAAVPTKTALQGHLAEKVVGVFRPEALGRLARRRQGRERCDIDVLFSDSGFDISFGFATNSKTEVQISNVPSRWIDAAPAFFPTREMLTIFPNFVSIYDGHYLEFEETWRDICVLLGAPAQRGPREGTIREYLEPLEDAMQGRIELDKNGRFYLNCASGRMEMPLVAEGLRKLGMLSRLIATGVLLDKGCLFWDEPEANLNPKLIRLVAAQIMKIADRGIQVFIATHSLFLLRELELLISEREAQKNQLQFEDQDHVCFFGLHPDPEGNGVFVQQGTSVDDIGEISSMEEEVLQSNLFLNDGLS